MPDLLAVPNVSTAGDEEALGRLAEAFGREVKVRPRGTGYKAELTIDDVADADLVAGLIAARRLS